MLFKIDCNNIQQLKQYGRERADTEYHPLGSCKMGPVSEPMAITDARLRVKGINALRVIDASIMPSLISGNTNAPSIMIGEKGADIIRQA